MTFKAFAVGLPTFGFGASISVIKDYIDMVIGMVKTFKDNGNELDMKVFNARRAKIKGMIKQYHSVLNKYEKELLKNELSVEDKPVAESVDDIKLAIYESCHAGEITKEERDELLGMI